MTAAPPHPAEQDHRFAWVAVLVVTALVATLIAFVGTRGFGLFGRKVDVLLIGDSIMAQSGGFVRDALVAQPGIGSATTQLDGRPGTGLLTPALFDWQEQAEDLIETHHPEVVVVLFIGNYSDQPDQQWRNADGELVPNDYGDRFYGAWLEQARRLNATLSADGAQVDWVLPPPLTGEEGTRREQRMRETYERLHDQVPGIGLIDARASLGGPDGAFTFQKARADGTLVPIRLADTVHLTADGGALLGRQMAEAVAPQVLAARQRER